MEDEELLLEQNGNRYTQFKLHQEYYAVEVKIVREILMSRDVTEVPGTPPFLQGVINLRGEIIPLFDLKFLFNFPGVDAGEGTFIIVLTVEEVSMAIQVDGVKEVVFISDDTILTGGRAVSGIHQDFIRGVARTTPLTTILNTEKIIQHIEEMLT